MFCATPLTLMVAPAVQLGMRTRIDQVPPINVHVIKSAEPPGGIGETGSTTSIPALRNAIYAATGVPLRRMPIDRALLAKGATS